MFVWNTKFRMQLKGQRQCFAWFPNYIMCIVSPYTVYFLSATTLSKQAVKIFSSSLNQTIIAWNFFSDWLVDCLMVWDAQIRFHLKKRNCWVTQSETLTCMHETWRFPYRSAVRVFFFGLIIPEARSVPFTTRCTYCRS